MQTPNTKPIAKHVKKQKSNLGKSSDQLKIHRNVYMDYLLNTLSFSARTVDKLMHLYDELVDSEDMENTFSLRIEIFHSAFIQKLQSL